MVKNEGIMDFLREYLSYQRRSVFTLGSDATKNCKRADTQTGSKTDRMIQFPFNTVIANYCVRSLLEIVAVTLQKP